MGTAAKPAEGFCTPAWRPARSTRAPGREGTWQVRFTLAVLWKCQHRHNWLEPCWCLRPEPLYLECLVGLSPSVKRLHVLSVQPEGFRAVLHGLLVLLQHQMAQRPEGKERATQRPEERPAAPRTHRAGCFLPPSVLTATQPPSAEVTWLRGLKGRAKLPPLQRGRAGTQPGLERPEILTVFGAIVLSASHSHTVLFQAIKGFPKRSP